MSHERMGAMNELMNRCLISPSPADLDVLEAYYLSDWLADFEAFRYEPYGILSEDGLYNLLCDRRWNTHEQ